MSFRTFNSRHLGLSVEGEKAFLADVVKMRGLAAHSPRANKRAWYTLGTFLVRARKIVPKHLWYTWVQDELELDRNTADRYMAGAALVERFDDDLFSMVGITNGPVICDLADPKIDDSIRDELLSAVMRGVNVTRDDVAERHRDFIDEIATRKGKPGARRLSAEELSLRYPGPGSSASSDNAVTAFKQEYIADLRRMKKLVDNANLGVTLDIGVAVASIKSSDARTYVEGTTGRLYPNQIQTIIEGYENFTKDVTQNGLFIGATQSGKTGTAVGMHLLAPIFYITTGIPLALVHILTSLKSHETQTNEELRNFYRYYGDIKYVFTKTGLNEDFMEDRSLSTYHQSVVNGTKINDDPIVRRRTTTVEEALRQDIASIRHQGMYPVVMVDESHFGATENECEKKVPDFLAAERRAILARARRAIGTEVPMLFMTATAYDLDGLVRHNVMWSVRQRLAEGYVGLNMYLGEPIDPTVTTRKPTIMNFGEYGEKHGIKNFKFINVNMYNKILDKIDDNLEKVYKDFLKWTAKISYPVGMARTPAMKRAQLTNYCEEVESSIRRMIYAVARLNGGKAVDGQPLGMCIRFCHANIRTDRLIKRLALNENIVGVIAFYDQIAATGRGPSVKELVHEHMRLRREKFPKTPEAPYLMICTARARMGDSFPRSCEQFIDFSNSDNPMTPGSITAILQGLFGRSTGMHKNPTVCLSYGNTITLRRYIDTMGLLDRKPNRHSKVKKMESKTVTSVSIRYDLNDERVNRFLDRVNAEIVMADVKQGTINFVKHNIFQKEVNGQTMTITPVMRIAEETGILDYLEANPEIAMKGNIDIPTVRKIEGVLRVARVGDTVTRFHGGKPSLYKYLYPEDANGNPDPNFHGHIYSEYLADEVHKRSQRRIKGEKFGRLHPQLLVKRYDLSHTQIRPVRSAITESVGPANRRVHAVVFPLVNEITYEGLLSGEVSSTRGHHMSDYFTPEMHDEVEETN